MQLRLKAEARQKIAAQVREKTAVAGLKAARITVRDQVTRWGSCAANGNLAFNWRLICAEPFVLDYVVAHEVAHLVHMDHSRRFWRIVDALCPEADAARSWLAKNGNDLMRYG